MASASSSEQFPKGGLRARACVKGLGNLTAPRGITFPPNVSYCIVGDCNCSSCVKPEIKLAVSISLRSLWIGLICKSEIELCTRKEVVLSREIKVLPNEVPGENSIKDMFKYDQTGHEPFMSDYTVRGKILYFDCQ